MKLSLRCSYKLIIAWVIALWTTFSHAQERPSILAGYGTLSGSILPLWVATEAGLFEKHGLQVKPIYLPRAAGRAALISGDIQVYFSAGPPLVQMRQGGADIAITSCVVHKFTSKLMVIPSIQKVADLRGKVLAVSNPGSLSDFAAKLFIARQSLKPGQDISVTYSGSTSAAFAALANGRVHGIFASSPSDIQAQAAGFKQLLDLGDMNIPLSGIARRRCALTSPNSQPGCAALSRASRRPSPMLNGVPPRPRTFCKNISASPMPLFCNIPTISNPNRWSPCRLQAPKGLKPSWNNLAYRVSRLRHLSPSSLTTGL